MSCPYALCWWKDQIFCFIVLHRNCSCWWTLCVCVCVCDRASLYILYSLNLFVSLSFVHSARLCKGQAMYACVYSQLVQPRASMCHSECWRLAGASKRRISEAVSERRRSLLPPSLLSSATPSGEQRERRLALAGGVEKTREEWSGKQERQKRKNKD